MPDTIRKRLEAIGQKHLLNFIDELPAEGQRALLEQIGSLDLEAVPGLVEQYVRGRSELVLPEPLEPAPYYPNDPTSPVRPWDRPRAKAIGEGLLRDGKVAAFTVAGGQGSRLGYDGPKGCYPAGPVTGKPLFQIFAEQILATGRKFGRPVPWYIMTSPLNHDVTRAFFAEHDYFGLDAADVTFFTQGVMPSFDMSTGRILLADKGRVATNPDGHGGSLKALADSGALDDMARRGVEHISYFQVDNPAVHALDPVFLGLHAGGNGDGDGGGDREGGGVRDSSGEMSSKMIPKAYPGEKLGMFCVAEGRVRVIEYSDLPMELQEQRLADGSLRFLAGSIAIHVLGVEFVRRLNEGGCSLPLHRAEKKVACVDPTTGQAIEPAEPNAVKLEMFVFDALPMCERSIVYETDRVEEFAPIKNAEGIDSPASSAELQTQRAARWLQTVGVDIPMDDDGKPDCVIEISPLTALGPDDLKGVDLPASIERGAKVAL